LSALSQTEESENYEMAKLDLRWHKTMNEELHALEKNQTWEIYANYQKIKKWMQVGI
jgi:hypothetical protein